MIMISDSAKSQRVNQAFLRSFSSRFLRSRVPQGLSAPFRPACPTARRGHARRFYPAKNLIVGKLTLITAPSASERLLSWRREIVHCSATILTYSKIKKIESNHSIITALTHFYGRATTSVRGRIWNATRHFKAIAIKRKMPLPIFIRKAAA